MMINIAKSSDMTRAIIWDFPVIWKPGFLLWTWPWREKKMPNNFFTNALASGSGKAVEVNSSKID